MEMNGILLMVRISKKYTILLAQLMEHIGQTQNKHKKNLVYAGFVFCMLSSTTFIIFIITLIIKLYYENYIMIIKKYKY